jgi:putative lipoic acid-binding regulatory protein
VRTVARRGSSALAQRDGGNAHARVVVFSASRPCAAAAMDRRPEIAYPSSWTYKVVGEGEEELFAHLERVLAGLAHEKTVSRKSTGGRYISIELTLVVRDEEQRLGLYELLQKHPAVRVVL